MKLYQILLGLILVSFPVMAGPYCPNGTVGDLEVDIISMGNIVGGNINNWVCIIGQGCEQRVILKNNGNNSINYWLNSSFLNQNTNITVSVYERGMGKIISPNETIYTDFDVEIPEGLNEDDNYLIVTKVYVNSSIDCDDDDRSIDLQNYRSIDVINVSITPNNLGCDTKNFTVTVDLENNFASTEDISLIIKDYDYDFDAWLEPLPFENNPGSLNLVYASDRFNMTMGETKTISKTFELPGFHLYSHSFVAYPISDNIHHYEWTKDYLIINKCSTDNAENLQEAVPKLKEKLQKIEDAFKRLFNCLSNQGLSC